MVNKLAYLIRQKLLYCVLYRIAYLEFYDERKINLSRLEMWFVLNMSMYNRIERDTKHIFNRYRVIFHYFFVVICRLFLIRKNSTVKTSARTDAPNDKNSLFMGTWYLLSFYSMNYCPKRLISPVGSHHTQNMFVWSLINTLTRALTKKNKAHSLKILMCVV